MPAVDVSQLARTFAFIPHKQMWRIDYWDGRTEAFLGDCNKFDELPLHVVDAENCIRLLYEALHQQESELAKLRRVAEAARKLDEIERHMFRIPARHVGRNLHTEAHIELHGALAALEEGKE